MTQTKSYEMKDSRVEWIREIPKHWNVLKLKYSSWLKGRIGWQGLKSTEYTDEGPYLITGTDFDNGHINWNSCAHISEERYLEDSDIHIKENDLLITKDGTIGKVAIARNCPPMVSLNSGVMLIRNTKRFKYFDKYLYYILLSDLFLTWYEFSQNGASTIRHLYQEQFYNFSYSFPPLPEQEAIASYLDEKCGAIDTLIAEAKTTIEEYKAWKASVIFEAVTKGLDPNVEMKDSGVEWMGEIPKHWSCIPMKFMLNERNQKNDPVVTSERLSLSIDIGVTLYAEKTTNLDRFKDDVSQYKVAHAGDLVLNSMNMIVGAVGIAPILGCVSPAYYVFYDNDDNHTVTRYCDYIFKNKRLRGCLFSLGQGIMAIDRGDGRINTCRLKVSRDDLGRIMLPCPPFEEQRRIISFLDKQCAVIDGIIAEKQTLINDLETYKKSLIYETVTGKRRVC